MTHYNLVSLVKDNLRDVSLRPTAYNNKVRKNNNRFNSSFIGVEDCTMFYIITIFNENRSKKKRTQILLDRNYKVLKEKYKESK